MKKGLLWLLGLLMLGVIVFLPVNSMYNPLALSDRTEHQKELDTKTSQESSAYSYQFDCLQKNGLHYVDVNELKNQLSIQVQIDQKNGQVFLKNGNTKVSFLKDVSVMEKNGLYYPMKSPLLYQEDQIWIPLDTVGKILDGTVQLNDSQATITIKERKSTSSIPTELPQMTADQLISYLSFLGNPIKGAHVSTVDSSLPGASRAYRKGIHEGIDWYGGETTGVPITKKTPVLSMADGVIVRIDHNYKEMTPEQRQQFLDLGKQNDGQTPQYVLDKLRGRSVWVQHDRGVMARYVHLDRVNMKLNVGQKVKKGEILGYVGNSGTSDGAKGNNEGLHLHLDIFIYGKWPWSPYTMKERRMILEKVFPANG